MKVVPAHLATERTAEHGTTGFCPGGGLRTETGHCQYGCDHSEHYSNDGHPSCSDDASKVPLKIRAGLYQYMGRYLIQTEWGPGPRGGKKYRWEVAEEDERGELVISGTFTHVTRKSAMDEIADLTRREQG
jgi:hypothetical protein